MTSLGSAGQLFAGYPALIYSPVAFDSVQADVAGVVLYSEVRERMAVLASGEEMLEAADATETDVNAGSEVKRGAVKFLQGEDEVVHQCVLTVIAFNPIVHNAMSLQDGDCSLKQIAGLLQLLPGHAQVWEFPRNLLNAGIWPDERMGIATLSERQMYLIGKLPGIGVLAWSSEEDGGFQSIDICVFEAASQSNAVRIAEKDICKDQSGVPMHLSVGQIVEFSVEDSAGNIVSDYELAISRETVVDEIDTFDKAEYQRFFGPVLKAMGSGSTSVALFFVDANGQAQANICEIIVN